MEEEIEGEGIRASLQAEGGVFYPSGSKEITRKDWEDMMELLSQKPVQQSKEIPNPIDSVYYLMTDEEREEYLILRWPYMVARHTNNEIPIAGRETWEKLEAFEKRMLDKYKDQLVADRMNKALTRDLKKSVPNKDYGNKQFYKKFKK